MQLFEMFGDITIRGVAAAERAINTVNNAGQKAGQSIAKFGQGVQAVGQGFQSAGATMSKFVTLPLVAAGTAVFKFGKDFEREMNKVVGLVGVSEKQVGEWSKAIMELAPKVSKAPQELAEALFFVTSAGLRGAEAMEVLEISAKGSAAGLGESATIADLLTSAINAYGKENLNAAQAGDILTAAVREGKAEAAELAGSMGAVLPLASEMGVQFNEVAAAQAAMTKTGTNANEAATQLKGIMAGLIKPSEQAEEQLKLMGTSSKNLRKTIKEEGLLSALMELKELTNKYGEEAMARVFPNIRALMGTLDLMGENLEENVKTFDAVKNSTGILENAFESASETLDFKWNQALSKIQVTALSFFDILKAKLIPILDNFMKILDFVGDGFSKLSPEIQNFILIFAGIFGIVGPVLLAIGTVITIVGGAIAGIGTIITAVSGIISTVGLPVIVALVAILGVVIGVVGGVVAAFLYLYKTNKDFRDNVLKIWNLIKDNAKIIWNEIQKTVTVVIAKIKAFWAKYGDEIMFITMKVFNFIFKYVGLTLNNTKDFILAFLKIIQGDWSSAWELIKGVFKRVFDFFNTYIEKIMNIIKTTIENKLEEWKTAITNKLTEWKTAIENKYTEIKDAIVIKLDEWWTAISEWFTSIPERIKEKLNEWAIAISEWLIVQNAENIRQFNEWWTAISEWFSSIPEKLGEKLNEWKTTISNKYTEMKTTISSKLTEWWTTINKWFSDAPGLFETGLEGVWTSLKKSFDNAKKYISDKLNEWWTTIKGWFTNLKNKPEIKNSGKEMVKKVAEGNKEQKPDFIDKLGKIIIDVAKAALLVAGVTLIATGRELIKIIIKGIKEMIGNVKKIGEDIVSGLISGMSNKLKALKQKVNEIGNVVKDGMTKLLKIQSPSRVMMEIGENITKGLEIGMDMDSFTDSLKKMKKEVTWNPVSDKITNNKSENFHLENLTIKIDELKDVQDIINIFKRMKIEKFARGLS